jgi:hypothetical protein
MHPEDKFIEELSDLLKKHNIERFTGFLNLDNRIRLTAHAPTEEEEKETLAEYFKLMDFIGSLEKDNIKKLNEFLTSFVESEESSQESWERVAHENAETFLSEEDYEKLEEAVILKNAAASFGSLESVAKHREEELRLLSLVVAAMEE